MGYKVVIANTAEKQIEKMDRKQQAYIYRYLYENLEDCRNPRHIPGSDRLQADVDDEWRYRVGSYRILASILDDKIVIRAIRGGQF